MSCTCSQMSLPQISLLVFHHTDTFTCFTNSSGNWPLLYNFRSSASAIHQWPVPLQTRGVLLVVQIEGRQHSRQVCSTEDHLEYRRRTCGVQITHSPFTLGNYSFINLVYVVRYYGSSHHLEYDRPVDPSVLAFSLSSHRHSNISLFFSSRFIDSK